MSRTTEPPKCQALERTDVNPMFVEEPGLIEDLDAMARIARSTRIPIVAGERCYTKYAFRELPARAAVSIAQPVLARCAGISEGLTIARMADYFAAFARHNPLGPINLAASLNVSAAADFLAQAYVSLGEGVLKTPFVLESGYLQMPAGPGLGY